MNGSNPYRRSLEGLVIGISISESSDSSDLGFSSSEINRVVVRIAEALLGEGARLLFGHNWRRDGVMTEIHRLALRYQASDHPVIMNLVPWPDDPGLSDQERREAAGTLEIREAGLPPDLNQQTLNRTTFPQAWLRARALTWMRRQMARIVDAQICLGGRTERFSGRYPGVVEEAYLVSQERKPQYFSGLLGGATDQMIRAIRRTDFSDAVFSTQEAVQQAFAQAPRQGDDPDARLDRKVLIQNFQSKLTMRLICQANRLTEAENDLLCDATNLDQVVAMILRGLTRLGSVQSSFERDILPIVFSEIEAAQPASKRAWSQDSLTIVMKKRPGTEYDSIEWSQDYDRNTLLYTAACVCIYLASIFQSGELIVAVAKRIVSLWRDGPIAFSPRQTKRIVRLAEQNQELELCELFSRTLAEPVSSRKRPRPQREQKRNH